MFRKTNKIFKITSTSEFNDLAIDIFRFQYNKNKVYRDFVDHLKIKPDSVTVSDQIPFLPVDFFKTRQIVVNSLNAEMVFKSSGTSMHSRAWHYVSDSLLYHKSFEKGFRTFYGDPGKYVFLALLPSYLEQGDSSLVYMVKHLIDGSSNSDSGFFLNNYRSLYDTIMANREKGKKILLFGVSYALLNFAEKFSPEMGSGIVMETGGMKGRRREMIREELHDVMKTHFGVSSIHSEYGMTELLSQAYSKGEGRFRSPPWMKILIREINDPLTLAGNNVTGGINVIDLANVYSCSFLATQDLGKTREDGSFEVLGRFDNSDIRGCNLLFS